MDTRPRTSLISFCTVQLRTLCAAHSLATLCLSMTSGPDPGELPGFWGSMFFRHAPIPRKGSGNQQQQELCLHQSTAASTWWCGPRPRLGWVEMAVGLTEGPSYPGHSPFIFSLCCPLNDRRRAAHSIFKIGRLFSLFLFSCLTLALLRLLILLLLLMSGNVYLNPGPIFPCSVCAGNVTWRGKSVQCCACSKWVHLRCSQLSLSNFRALGSSHSWSCPPCRNTVTPPSSDSSGTYTSTVQSGPPLLMLHSCPTLVSKLLIPHLPILYLLPLPSHHRPLLLAILLHLLSSP